MILRKACFPLFIMIVFFRKSRSGKGMPQKAGYGILLTAESFFGRLKQDKQTDRAPAEEKSMTLQQLRYVIMTADCGSMNEAAKRLFISQPSLSGTIKELEEEIGLDIFLRSLWESVRSSIWSGGKMRLSAARPFSVRRIIMMAGLPQEPAGCWKILPEGKSLL